ncbi:tetratricopeptide repeat protein [Planctomycetota bacterium]|nr:tetratricopeptide repeat protein [Planctomycetota bacterium]
MNTFKKMMVLVVGLLCGVVMSGCVGMPETSENWRVVYDGAERAMAANDPWRANNLAKRALELAEAAEVRDELRIVKSQMAIGISAYQMDEKVEGFSYLDKVVAAKDVEGDADVDGYVDVLTNVSLFYGVVEQHERGLRAEKRLVAVCEKAYGKDSPKLTTGLNNMGYTYFEMGRYDEAVKVFRRTLGIYKKVGVNGTENQVGTQNNLALALNALGDYKEAGEMFFDSMRKAELSLGERDKHVLAMRFSAGVMFMKAGDDVRAKRELELVEKMYRQIWKQGDLRLALTLDCLANVYKKSGQSSLARGCAEEAFDLYRGVMGDYEAEMASQMERAALGMRKLNRIVEAEMIESRAKKVRAGDWSY